MPVDIEVYDPKDTTLLGPAEEVLRLPGIIDTPHWTPDMPTNPDGTPKFNYQRKQQTWKTDTAVIPGDIEAYYLIRNTDNPKLIPYYVPKEWAQVPNIQTNPSMDGIVFPYAPRPCRALAADEHLVVVRVGIFFPEVWIRKGAKPVPPSTGGAGLSQEEHDALMEVLIRVRSLTV